MSINDKTSYLHLLAKLQDITTKIRVLLNTLYTHFTDQQKL